MGVLELATCVHCSAVATGAAKYPTTSTCRYAVFSMNAVNSNDCPFVSGIVAAVVEMVFAG